MIGLLLQLLVTAMFLEPLLVKGAQFRISPCGHVYRYTPRRRSDGMRFTQWIPKGTVDRLYRSFSEVERLIHHKDLNIIEDLQYDDDRDFDVISRRKLDIAYYMSLKDAPQVISIFLPDIYETLQHLAFVLKIVHLDLESMNDEASVKKHVLISELIEKNALLICEVDFAMRRNGVSFYGIDQLTIPQEWITPLDETFTQVKHSRILWEYRKFVKTATSIFQKHAAVA